jgi:uncharacterized protein (DUF433 family)
LIREELVMFDPIGLGIYSLPEASRLTGAEAREIRRWLFGYRFRPRSGEDVHYSPPLWRSQLADAGGYFIGFRDLVELRFVQAFVRAGVHLQVVRAALAAAGDLFGTYPFSKQKFLTDGKAIFHEVLESDGVAHLLDLGRKQFAFHSIFRPSLYVGLEFNDRGEAARWFPLPRSRAVVLDPDIAFGHAALTEYGIPTETIADAMLAEKSRARVAAIFGIPATAVDAAVRFEQRTLH